jgi:hypothetical protein
MSNTATKVFNTFNGVWSFTRKIAGSGHMNGLAKFEKLNSSLNELIYKENGLFIFDNGNQIEAHREYLYRLNKKTNQLEVYFVENDNNNRLFHTLEFKNINDNLNETTSLTSQKKQCLSANALHECIKDTYKIKYEIFKDNEFKIVYTVNGPSKNYVSETYFIKIDANTF